MGGPNPFTLRHKPVVLLPYSNHDGPFARKTDCLYLSIGYAQYDPKSLSAKALRHTGGSQRKTGRWSRQSEEIPLHRAVDLTLLIAEAIRAATETTVTLPPRTLEFQDSPISLETHFGDDNERRAFQSKICNRTVLNRLSVLRGILNDLHNAGLLSPR